MTGLSKKNNLDEAAAWLGTGWTSKRIIEAGASGKIRLLAINPSWRAPGLGELDVTGNGNLVSDGLVATTEWFLDSLLTHGSASLENLPGVTGEAPRIDETGLRVLENELMRFRDAISDKPAAKETSEQSGTDAGQKADELSMRGYASNAAKIYKSWIAHQARELINTGDTRAKLAARIVDLANKQQYYNEGGNKFNADSVVKFIPSGITGTRSKNGRKKATID